MTERDPLQEAARDLPREIEPGRDLWPDIEARLGEREPPAEVDVVQVERRAWRRGLRDAAILIGLFLAGWTLAHLEPDFGGGERVATAPNAAETTGAATPTRVARPLDADYVAASRAVFDELERRELDPETVDVIRRNLDTIDTAVKEIRDALELHSEDPRLQKRLATEIRRRGDVLKRAAEIHESI
jgi:hypothetical protein